MLVFKNEVSYFYHKFIASGFAFSLFIAIVFALNRMSLFELSEMVRSVWLWIAFYPYAILASITVDGFVKIHWLSKKNIRFFQLILYIAFGFIPFIFYMEIPFIIIAGLVGAFAACLFLIGLKCISKQKWLRLIFAFVLPGLLLFVAMNDFTKKEKWFDDRSNTSYQASFHYFDGEHKIPVQLKKGEKIIFDISFHAVNGGGWGNHLEDRSGEYMGMELEGKEDNAPVSFVALDDTTYYIVVSGHQVQGKFSVEWTISQL